MHMLRYGSAGAADRPARARRRRGLFSVAAVLAGLVGAPLALVPAVGGSAAAAVACTVSYQVNQWSGGFTAQVSVVNGGAALTSWTVGWSFDAGQQVTSAWNAQVTQTGRTVSAVNEAYNGAVAAGGTIGFGFQGTWAGSNDTPTDFTLNGVSCAGGATGTPSGSPTPTPTATATPTPTSTVTATPTGTPTPGSCNATGVVFCDGFESQMGSVPSGRWSVYSRDCSGTGTATIDSATAHSGGKSARVVGFDGYCNHVFIRDAADMGLAGPVWDVRFWVMHTRPLPTGHVTFVAMNDAHAGNTDLRFGGQNGALMWNRQSDDQTLPDQSPAGVAQSAALPVNMWNCVELQVNGSTGAIATWLNGTQITGLSESGTPVSGVSDQWLSGNGAQWRPSLTDLKLGWESYGGGGDDTLWFDDIALSSSRIGC